jgi:hypothetical protein
MYPPAQNAYLTRDERGFYETQLSTLVHGKILVAEHIARTVGIKLMYVSTNTNLDSCTRRKTPRRFGCRSGYRCAETVSPDWEDRPALRNEEYIFARGRVTALVVMDQYKKDDGCESMATSPECGVVEGPGTDTLSDLDRDRLRKQRKKKAILDRARRRKQVRDSRRDKHEMYMEQRIDHSMSLLQSKLEEFCEENLMVGDGVLGVSPRPLAGGLALPGAASQELILDGRRESAEATLASATGQVDIDAAWMPFCRLCSSAGLDPLLLYHSVSLKLRSSFDSNAYQKYLSALAVVILDVCDAQKALTGGLCGIHVVRSRVRRRGGMWLKERSDDLLGTDIIRAIEAMQKLMNKPDAASPSVCIVAINGTRYVSTADFTFDEDCMSLLRLFEKEREGLTRRDAMDELRWSEERVVDGLTKLMRDGLIWVDLPPEATPMLYWCPSITFSAN